MIEMFCLEGREQKLGKKDPDEYFILLLGNLLMYRFLFSKRHGEETCNHDSCWKTIAIDERGKLSEALALEMSHPTILKPRPLENYCLLTQITTTSHRSQQEESSAVRQ